MIILGKGYILLTAKVLYDPAVFQSGKAGVQSIQAYVEEPENSIIAMSSSSINDQIALISDRVSCIRDMNLQIFTKNGIQIKDKLIFFIGINLLHNLREGHKYGGTTHVEYVVHISACLMTLFICPIATGDLYRNCRLW